MHHNSKVIINLYMHQVIANLTLDKYISDMHTSLFMDIQLSHALSFYNCDRCQVWNVFLVYLNNINIINTNTAWIITL